MDRNEKYIIEKLKNILGDNFSETKEDILSINDQKKKAENDRFKQDTTDRKRLAYWSAVVVSIYLILLFGILIFNERFINLTNSVLIVLLGTTTLNILGLMFIVLKGLFPNIK